MASLKTDGLVLILLSAFMYGVTWSQQCLDSLPPFESTTTLQFCPGTSRYGCCTADDDTALRERYNRIINFMSPEERTRNRQCLAHVRNFLCARCSPYSAEIFSGMSSPSVFPGLCGEFCSTFYRRCSSIIQDYLDVVADITSAQGQVDLLSTMTIGEEEMFCHEVSLPIGHSQYCFPDVESAFGLNTRIDEEHVKEARCVCLEPFDIRLRNPVVLTNGNDRTNRLFVVEQIGVVKILRIEGNSVSDKVFLDIRTSVVNNGDGSSRLGLLGLAVHPKFSDNGKIYVLYTAESHTSVLTVRVEEFRVSDTDIDRANMGTRRVILEITKETIDNVGGSLLFGADGYLYIFTGDDGGVRDAGETAQDLFLLSGKVLRINIDAPDFPRGTEYSIPDNNPFANQHLLGLPEIYAWGLRNPLGCSVDRGTRIFCADRGESRTEEINIIDRADNYGWNIKEGTDDFCPDCLRGIPGVDLTGPIFQYRHTIGRSVVGGGVYRGCLNPNLEGHYIFGDYQEGLLHLAENNQTKQWTGERLEICPPSQCRTPLTNQIQPFILSFGHDEHREMYVLTSSEPSLMKATGTLYRIVDPIRRGDPINCVPARPSDGLSAVSGDKFPEEELDRTETQQDTEPPPPRPRPPRRGSQQGAPAVETFQNEQPGRRSIFGMIGRLFGIGRRTPEAQAPERPQQTERQVRPEGNRNPNVRRVEGANAAEVQRRVEEILRAAGVGSLTQSTGRVRVIRGRR